MKSWLRIEITTYDEEADETLTSATKVPNDKSDSEQFAIAAIVQERISRPIETLLAAAAISMEGELPSEEHRNIWIERAHEYWPGYKESFLETLRVIGDHLKGWERHDKARMEIHSA